MTEHTHVTTKVHSLFDKKGNRYRAEAGTKCTPTEAQLENMPDVFLTIDGDAVGVPDEKHGMRGKSNGSIKDLVLTIDDLDVLDEMATEEAEGRNRVGALGAITARIEDVTAANEEAAGE